MLTIIVVSILAAIALLLFVRAKRQLHEIGTAARALADGHLGARVPVHDPFGVSPVSSAFNEMATQVEATVSQLHETQTLLTSVLNSSLDGIMALAAVRDPDGRIVDFRWILVDDVAEGMLRRPASGLMGHGLLEELPCFGPEGLFDAFVQVVETGVPADLEQELRYQALQGWYQLRVAKLGDGIALTFADIGRRKRAEAAVAAYIRALEATDRYKDEFLAILGHELRTPLNAVIGFGSFLEEGLHGPLNADQAEDVAQIMAGAGRLRGVVENLLDAAAIQAGRLVIDPQPCAFQAVAEAVLDQQHEAAAAKGVALEGYLAVPGEVEVDGQRIAQVLTNLVSNAIKFTPAGGQVRVRAWEDGGNVITEVRDTGVGIPADDLPGLFSRFRQGDMTSTREAGGLGLGLAITRALVTAHQGTIMAESTVGAGSTFRVVLPRHQASRAQVFRGARAAHPGSGRQPTIKDSSA